MSLRFRLSLLIAFITLSAMTLFAILEYTLFTRSQLEQLELVLERDLERAQSLLTNPLLGASLSGLNQGSFVQQFVNTDGLVVIPPGTKEALPYVEAATIVTLAGNARLVAQIPWVSQDGNTIGSIRGALDISSAIAVRRTLQRSLLLSSVIIAVLAVLSGLWLLRRDLNPLRRLAAEARQIDPAHPRMAVYEGPEDEVAAVAHALNSVLQGIRERQEAERASLAEIAHELAAPLSLVAGHLQSLQKQVNDPRLESAKDAADELLYTSQDLLTLARGELEQALDFKICNLAEVVARVAKAYPTVHLKGLTQAQIAGNGERLTQLIRNLVRNAVQATTDQGDVWLELREQGSMFELEVKDSGAGISEDDLENIFERFFTKRGGVGVGLSVAKRIAKQHGGDIKVESVLGEGTTFVVTLPSLASMTE